MQLSHPPKTSSCGRKKTKCHNTCGDVLGKGMDFLLLQTSCCSCRIMQRQAQSGPAFLRPGTSVIHLCTLLLDYSHLLLRCYEKVCGEQNQRFPENAVVLALGFAGGIACGVGGVHREQEAYGHPAGTRDTSPPKQPLGYALTFGTLWPCLDPSSLASGLPWLTPFVCGAIKTWSTGV